MAKENDSFQARGVRVPICLFAWVPDKERFLLDSRLDAGLLLPVPPRMSSIRVWMLENSFRLDVFAVFMSNLLLLSLSILIFSVFLNEVNFCPHWIEFEQNRAKNPIYFPIRSQSPFCSKLVSAWGCRVFSM